MSSEAEPTILVVDDNPATLYTTGRFLKAAGFTVVEAKTGEEALKLAEAGPDAVVLDVNLPDIDGFEVCRRLRAQEATLRTPIIHLSATFVGDVDKVHGLEAGADGYLTHPVEPPVLIATVRAFLRARQAEEGMRRSEERFRAIFDQAAHGIALLSEDLVYIEVNPAFCKMLGRSREDLVGKLNASFVPKVHEHQLPNLAKALNEEGFWTGTLPLIRTDSRWVELEWSISRHSLPGVRLAMATDITARRRLEAEREHLLASERAARTDAERANRLKDEFLATLSHELRTPLAAIVGWAQILQRQPVEPEDVREAVEAITRNANSQNKLIADLLDVARITSGKMHLDVQRVDPATVIEMSLEAVMPAAKAKEINLVRNLSGSVGMISADPSRLQQVIWNLANNAVKFTPARGSILFTLTRVKNHVEIVVADTGQGIPADFLPHLFERFRQENATTRRNHGGLGLGLAIVKHLVEMHGGTVTVESGGLGRGSTFTVRLPIAAPARDEKLVPGAKGAGELPKPAEPAAPSALEGLRILIVDDDHDARSIIKRVLVEYEAVVHSAGSALEALSAIESFGPHLLVSDIGMPEMDGYDLLRAIREGGRTAKGLPAIALTAFARPEDRVKAENAGFQVHLSKPVDPNELVATLARLAQRSPAAP